MLLLLIVLQVKCLATPTLTLEAEDVLHDEAKHRISSIERELIKTSSYMVRDLIGNRRKSRPSQQPG